MATVTRFWTKNWNYIRAAIFLYFVCFAFTVAYLSKTKHTSLLWLSGATSRDLTTKGGARDKTETKPAISFEIVKVVTPKRVISGTPDRYVINMFNDSQAFCNGDFIGYGKLLAKLSNVVIDPQFGIGRKGGESIKDVFKQQEEKEYFQLQTGYFNLKCSGKISYSFIEKSHLTKWVGAIKLSEGLPATSGKISTWTLAVMRYEYANLYHTMTDYYNAFLATKIFHLDPDQTNILWVDGHPIGALDSTWDVLFGNVTRAGDLKEPVMFENLVWSTIGYSSVMNHHNVPFLPHVEEFREFFLSRHNIELDNPLDCQKLNVLFLWRRDYLAHPRNPSGHVSRKIKNEDELLLRAKELLPGHVIEGIQIDNLTMTEQLRKISETDILIGMHGAGLTHTTFLPKHAGLIELFPTYWSSANRHFRAMSQWRGIHYKTWSNRDSKRELSGHYTVVDVDAVMKMLHELHHDMCGSKAHAH